MTVLCNVCTKGRYDTTLPLTLMAIAMQTMPPHKLVIFDDNDDPKDMREVQTYQYLFEILQLKNIPWEWVYAQKKGQHFSHQTAQRMAVDQGHTWVWRVDDDAVPEPNVLENLYNCTGANYAAKFGHPIGAVGGAVLTPPFSDTKNVTGKIEMISSEPNLQWNYI